MPHAQVQPVLARAENAEAISAAPPTNAHHDETNERGSHSEGHRGLRHRLDEHSLTSATSTVTPASVARARPNGHGASSGLCMFRTPKNRDAS